MATFEEWDNTYIFDITAQKMFTDWKAEREEKDREIERLQDMYQVHYKARIKAEARVKELEEGLKAIQDTDCKHCYGADLAKSLLEEKP